MLRTRYSWGTSLGPFGSRSGRCLGRCETQAQQDAIQLESMSNIVIAGQSTCSLLSSLRGTWNIRVGAGNLENSTRNKNSELA